ncbi:MAG: hypothetical protein RMA76_38440 [Deltaproteobacteria bacterium]|jgi:hypothetical protein
MVSVGWARLAALAAILVTSAISTGCATMFSGSEQDISLKVYPEDATTKVDNEPVDPGALKMTREKQHIVTIEKPGFETRRIQMKQDLNGWFFANILWGPFFWVGMIVDAMTGSLYELSPSNVTVTLDPEGSRPAVASSPPPPPPSSGISFVTPGSGPSLDPTVNQRGTGMNKKSPPPPPPPKADAPPPPSSPPPPAAPERKRPPRTMANATQQSWVLAVMDSQMSSSQRTFTKETLVALTDQIRVFLASRGMRVVDRSSQERALQSIVAEEKKNSYKTCVDSSCQIPLGKALAATHIMRSSVAKFGNACATNGEMIDLRSEVTVAAGSARSGCTEEDLLYAAESLAEQLVTGSSAAK